MRQGVSLSTKFFNSVIEGIIKQCELDGNIMENAYADDLAIITREREVEIMLKLSEAASKRGSEINQPETKYMRISRMKRSRPTEIVIGKYKF